MGGGCACWREQLCEWWQGFCLKRRRGGSFAPRPEGAGQTLRGGGRGKVAAFAVGRRNAKGCVGLLFAVTEGRLVFPAPGGRGENIARGEEGGEVTAFAWRSSYTKGCEGLFDCCDGGGARFPRARRVRGKHREGGWRLLLGRRYAKGYEGLLIAVAAEGLVCPAPGGRGANIARGGGRGRRLRVSGREKAGEPLRFPGPLGDGIQPFWP